MTIFFLLVTGTAIGSFLNVLIDRLSMGESIMGRSHCDRCKHTLAPLDLVPVFSFLALRGKCRYCKTKLSWQYPLVELLTAVMFVISWTYLSKGPDIFLSETLNPGQVLASFLYLALTAVFVVIFIADLKYRIIPDEMQIAFLLTVFLLRVVQGATITGLGFTVFSGALVMLPILLLYLITRGRGMGFGDVKLAFNIGFFLGLKGGLLSLYFGFMIGAVVGISLLVAHRKKLKSKIAFGPFLLLGVLVVLAFREPLYSLLQRIYGI